MFFFIVLETWRKCKNFSGLSGLGVIRGAVNNAANTAQAFAGTVKYAFLIEHGFHTNSRECAFLSSDENLRKIAKAESDAIKEYFGIAAGNAPEYTGLPIIGESEATAEQMLAHLLANNQEAGEFADLPVLYLQEGAAEGVRGDAAFCMACKETGFFKFGGDVKKEQNNFCGLGATGGGNPGHSFASHRLGVRANIQHLKAYGSTESLACECVDPRFGYVKRGVALTFEELAGKWAVPGYNTKVYKSLKEARNAKDAYGDNIVSMLGKILSTGTGGTTQAPETPQTGPKKVIGTVRVIYPGADGLDIHKMPEWGDHNLNTKNGPVHFGETFRVTEKVKVGNSYMYELYSGAGYITAAKKYVEFTALTEA